MIFFEKIKKYMAKFKKVSLMQVASFARQFSILYKSGLALNKSLEVLVEQQDDLNMKEAISGVHRQIVLYGSKMSVAFRKYPQVFPNVLTSLIAAGEESGYLSFTLDRASILLEKNLKFRNKLKSALIYPVIVSIFAVILIIGMVQFIFPNFIKFFANRQIELPLPTQILVFSVKLFQNPIAIIVLLFTVICMVYLFGNMLRTPHGKYTWDRFKYRIPLYGKIYKQIIVADFCRTLALLLESGFPFTKALEVIRFSAADEYFKENIKSMEDSIKEGELISDFMSKSVLFWGLPSNMITVGEETGAFGKVLTSVANYYETEVEHILENISNIIEPVITVFVGVIVGFILISVLMPLYSILMDIGVQ
ncbi:MAG: type II secretion system F family protein [Armatimonadota bacterium]